MTGSFPTYALLPGDVVRPVLDSDKALWQTSELDKEYVIEAGEEFYGTWFSFRRVERNENLISYVSDVRWPVQLVARQGKRVKSVIQAKSKNLRVEFTDGTTQLWRMADMGKDITKGRWGGVDPKPFSTNAKLADGRSWDLLYQLVDETKEAVVVTEFKKGDRVTIAKGAKSMYSTWPDGGVGTVKGTYGFDCEVILDKGVRRTDGATFVCDGQWAAVFNPKDLTLVPTGPETATDAEIDAALAVIKKRHGLCEEFDNAVEEARTVPTYLERLEEVANGRGRANLYDELVKELTLKLERKVKWPKGTLLRHVDPATPTTILTVLHDVYEGDTRVTFKQNPTKDNPVTSYQRVKITVVD